MRDRGDVTNAKSKYPLDASGGYNYRFLHQDYDCSIIIFLCFGNCLGVFGGGMSNTYGEGMF